MNYILVAKTEIEMVRRPRIKNSKKPPRRMLPHFVRNAKKQESLEKNGLEPASAPYTRKAKDLAKRML